MIQFDQQKNPTPQNTISHFFFFSSKMLHTATRFVLASWSSQRALGTTSKRGGKKTLHLPGFIKFMEFARTIGVTPFQLREECAKDPELGALLATSKKPLETTKEMVLPFSFSSRVARGRGFSVRFKTRDLLPSDHRFVMHHNLHDINSNDPEAKEDQPSSSSVESVTSKRSKSDIRPRQAVAAIMGHIDHGKTTLLDWIRGGHAVTQEVGNITQYISCFNVSLPRSEDPLSGFVASSLSLFLFRPTHDRIQSRGSQDHIHRYSGALFLCKNEDKRQLCL